MKFLDGWKTYIVAAAVGCLGAAQIIWPEFVVPAWVWPVLGAAGLGAIRDALNK